MWEIDTKVDELFWIVVVWRTSWRIFLRAVNEFLLLSSVSDKHISDNMLPQVQWLQHKRILTTFVTVITPKEQLDRGVGWLKLVVRFEFSSSCVCVCGWAEAWQVFARGRWAGGRRANSQPSLLPSRPTVALIIHRWTAVSRVSEPARCSCSTLAEDQHWWDTFSASSPRAAPFTGFTTRCNLWVF